MTKTDTGVDRSETDRKTLSSERQGRQTGIDTDTQRQVGIHR